jgi:catechol 2,3-dioxygenase-like lactoylglutathione lyase family enzyme
VRPLLLLVWFCFPLLLYAQEPPTPPLRFEGLRIWVNDLEAAKAFYTEVLGLAIATEDQDKKMLKLNTRPVVLYLSEAENNSSSLYGKHSRTSLTLQVPALLPAIDRLRKAGVALEELELQRNGVGISIPFKDPAGNLLSIIEVQVRPVTPFKGFKIYNAGITTSAMEEAIQFYVAQLGFEEWSRDYLPAAMPLKHPDDSFAFMLHAKPGLTVPHISYGQDSDMNLIFSTNDLKALERYLNKAGISTRTATTSAGFIFKDPFGNHCEVIQK